MRSFRLRWRETIPAPGSTRGASAGISSGRLTLVIRPSKEGRYGAGRDGFVEFVRIWTEGFEEWSIRVERLIDAGNDRVVALTRQTAIGKGSGVPVELYVGQVWELEDGRVARVTNYMTQSDALQAAGLSE
jgi:ketosteroid isomerase-like protein